MGKGICVLCHGPVSGGGSRHPKGRCAFTAPKDRRGVHHANAARKSAERNNQATAGRGVAVAGTRKVSASSKQKKH